VIEKGIRKKDERNGNGNGTHTKCKASALKASGRRVVNQSGRNHCFLQTLSLQHLSLSKVLALCVCLC